MRRGLRLTLLLSAGALAAMLAGVFADLPARFLNSAAFARSERAAEAERLYQATLDALLYEDLPDYIDAVAALWKVDPNFAQPIIHVSMYFGGYPPDTLIDFMKRAAARVADARLRDCLLNRSIPAAYGSDPPFSRTRSVQSMADYCMVIQDIERGHGGWDDTTALRLAREAYAFNSDAGSMTRLWNALGRVRRWREIIDLIEPVLSSDAHPLYKAQGHAWRVFAYHQLGDERRARQAEEEAIRFANVGGRAKEIIGSALVSHEDGFALSLGEMARSDPLHLAITARLGWQLRRASAEGRPHALADYYRARGENLIDTGRPLESISFLDSAIMISRRIGNHHAARHALMRRGRALVKAGDLAAAEASLLAARSISGTAWPSTMMEIAHNLFHTYESSGAIEKARAAGAEFIRLADQSENRGSAIVSYRDVGLWLLRSGFTAEAMALFKSMISEIHRMRIEYLWAGEVFELTGQLDSAASYFEREWREGANKMRGLGGLIRITQETDPARAIEYATFHDRFLHTQSNPEAMPMLPSVLRRAGRIQEAVTGYEAARHRLATNGQLNSWLNLSADFADLLLEVEPARAWQVSDSVAVTARRVNARDIELRAIGTRELAAIKVHGQQTGSSIAQLRRARVEAERTRLSTLVAHLYRLEGEAWAAAGNAELALTALRKADDLTTSIAGSLAADVSRATYRAARIQISNRALLVAARGQELNPYVEWLGRRKARTQLEANASPKHVSIQALQRMLAPTEAVIDYSVLDSLAYGLVITARNAELIQLPVGARSLESAVGSFRRASFAAVGSQLDLTRARFDVQQAHSLWRILIAPLQHHLGSAQRLYIAADGILHLVPFDALVSRTGPSPRFLVDDHEVVLAPSLSALDRRPPGRRLESVVVLAAASAPGAETEAAKISRAFGAHRTTRLVTPNATRATLQAAVPDNDIIHFAVHAQPNEREPEYARLRLDGTPLYAQEVLKLALDGKLIVLSACETASGRLLNGEGVLNLSRTFHSAGAIATVATLWPVGAPTADFMARFYAELAAGASMSTALRSAKLHLRHSSAYQSPLYWAPFTLVTKMLEPVSRS